MAYGNALLQYLHESGVTASATYHRRLAETSIWATTVGLGRNKEPETSATNALLPETGVTLRDRDAFFGRFE